MTAALTTRQRPSGLAERRGEQRVYAGDLVIDDVLGQGRFVRFDGPDIVVEFGSGEAVREQAMRGANSRLKGVLACANSAENEC